MPKKLMENINLGHVFLKPSQGIFGIRRVKTPAWDKQAEQLVLRKIRDGVRAMAPSSLCIGKSGKNFFKCLQEQANSHLPYAGVSGVWYAALLEKRKDIAEEILKKRFVTGWKSKKPDTAVANGRRLVHAILAGLSLDDAMRMYFVVPRELIDREIAKKANEKAGGHFTDTDIDAMITAVSEDYVNMVVQAFDEYRKTLDMLHLPDYMNERIKVVKGVSLEDLRNKVKAKLGV